MLRRPAFTMRSELPLSTLGTGRSSDEEEDQSSEQVMLAPAGPTPAVMGDVCSSCSCTVAVLKCEL